MTKPISLVLTFLLTLILSFLPNTQLVFQESNSTQEMLDARELFENNCARCHGKDGRARTFRGRILRARNLANEEWQAKATDEQIADAIKKGPRSMPSFENKLSQAEIDSLVKYVRDLKQEKQKRQVDR